MREQSQCYLVKSHWSKPCCVKYAMHNALKNNIPACKLVMPTCKPILHDLLSFCDKTGLSYHLFTAWGNQSEETIVCFKSVVNLDTWNFAYRTFTNKDSNSISLWLLWTSDRKKNPEAQTGRIALVKAGKEGEGSEWKTIRHTIQMPVGPQHRHVFWGWTSLKRLSCEEELNAQ